MEMDAKLIFTVLLVATVLTTTTVCGYDKKCIPYCGESTNMNCPSNYTCTNWDGCGPSCLRSSGYQPDYCPMAGCMAISCPLGFERDGRGCEGCNCARMDVLKWIEEQDFKGAASQMYAFTPLWLTAVYSIFRYL